MPGPLQGTAIVTIGFLATFLGLETVGESRLSGLNPKTSSFSLLSLAYLLALGVGLHNLGEGLAIGAAYALGEIALGALLVIGFTLQNITEGLAIVAPTSNEPARMKSLMSIGLIAGVPTVFGTWIGGFSFSTSLATLFLAIGAGAIVQVVYEILRYMGKGDSPIRALVTPRNLLGLVLGLLLMYTTGLLVAI